MGMAALIVTSFTIPNPTSNFFVNDFAGVISESDRAIIQQRAANIQSQHNGTQIVVVTVNSLNGQTIEQFAHRLFNQWGIGNRDRNNGVLLLIVPGAPRGSRMRIEVGYGLEGILTDGMAGYILDRYVVPHYEQGDFSQAAIQGFNRIAGTITGDFVASTENRSGYPIDNGLMSYMPLYIILFLSFWITFFFGGLGHAFFGAIFSYTRRKQMHTEFLDSSEGYINAPQIRKNWKKKKIGIVLIGIVLQFLLGGLFPVLLTSFVLPVYLLIAIVFFSDRKYNCPNCTEFLSCNEVVIIPATYTQKGMNKFLFSCSACYSYYDDTAIIPRLSDSSGFGGGSSGGGGGGGSSGGGGASR